MNFLLWLEQSSPSVWVRETDALLGLPGMLYLHTIGMGMLVGASLVIGLRIMGVASSLPLAPFARFRVVIGFGVWLNVISGLALLLGYPTKALTNPMFYLKISAIIVAGLAWRAAMRPLFSTDPPAVVTTRLRRIVLLSVCSWFVAVLCGRLLAYTYSHLLAGSP